MAVSKLYTPADLTVQNAQLLSTHANNNNDKKQYIVTEIVII
jgi:hypothetical protein